MNVAFHPIQMQNFNSNMSTAAVFLDIQKAFDTTLHYGLLYKLSNYNFRAISSRLSSHINPIEIS
jgi:hypothetical protein